MERIYRRKRSKVQVYLSAFLLGTTVLATQGASKIEALDFENSHLGTFEGQTVFQLAGETGVLPTLELELRNQDGSIGKCEENPHLLGSMS